MEQPCQHVTAALLRAESDGTLKRFQQENELALGQRMLSALNRAMPGGETVRLLAVLRLYEDGRIGLGLSAGQAIDWPLPDGGHTRLTVLDVVWQPEAAGELHR